MTTYERLYKIVSPHLRAYKEDLTKHDRNALKEFNGPFLYGFRDTGTNLLRLGDPLNTWFPDMIHTEIFGNKKKLKDADEACDILEKEIVWIVRDGGNKSFLHFNGKVFRKITDKQAREIWKSYVDSLRIKSIAI